MTDFTDLEVDPGSRTTILVHYYRAMVGRADVWRLRMDTTTHWAIGATAAIVSFTLSDPGIPHYVVAIAAFMTLSFLFLEARRLTFYNLFQQRVLLLEEGLMRPALASWPTHGELPREAARPLDLTAALAPHLGRTVPTMALTKAAARRLRRVYIYLFGVQLFAWALKLANHPTPARTLDGLIERAGIGLLPGGAVLVVVSLLAVIAVGVAVTRGRGEREASA